MKDVVETLLDDDSPERQIRKLNVRILKLEKEVESLKPAKNPLIDLTNFSPTPIVPLKF